MTQQSGKSEQEVKKTAADPVCGMTVEIPSDHRYDYRGKAFYFCSDSCRSKFQADPAKYVAKQE
jgi:Cu+-exporting ATPase